MYTESDLTQIYSSIENLYLKVRPYAKLLPSAMDQLYLKVDQHIKLLPPSFQERISLLVNDTTDLFKRSNLDRIALLSSMCLPTILVKYVLFSVNDANNSKNQQEKMSEVSVLKFWSWKIEKSQSESLKYKIADLTSWGIACSIVGIAASKRLGGTFAGGLGAGLVLLFSEVMHKTIKKISSFIYEKIKQVSSFVYKKTKKIITKFPLEETQTGMAFGATSSLLVGRNFTKGMLIGGGLGFVMGLGLFLK